jgi:hypothetical protein
MNPTIQNEINSLVISNDDLNMNGFERFNQRLNVLKGIIETAAEYKALLMQVTIQLDSNRFSNTDIVSNEYEVTYDGRTVEINGKSLRIAIMILLQVISNDLNRCLAEAELKEEARARAESIGSDGSDGSNLDSASIIRRETLGTVPQKIPIDIVRCGQPIRTNSFDSLDGGKPLRSRKHHKTTKRSHNKRRTAKKSRAPKRKSTRSKKPVTLVVA